MGRFADRLFAVSGLIFAAYAALGCTQEYGDPAIARVQIEYVRPENFADVRDRYSPSDQVRDFYLNALAQHIERRALRYLPEGHKLVVSITEVDMAGNFEPWRAHLGNTRVVRDVYPPRIDLAFTWTDSRGTVLKEGDRKLRDLNFMLRAGLSQSDPLRYEKALLDDWLEREFRSPPA